ncbi:uncharacterized protein XM38_039730 [Halomicronema hongdechloris C2206]|uniref:Uncharacterized protein n=1 Tax=Halomicronema hongdechloris C2206 TaxID=1641165 RepID=A0A1Z3HRR2_9CYAN|nr:hypothetical protein [Halomicronema hongdechloris]ASC73011.1 uncharacterized protein XM38_039730 [Halomicronema hongdechloris C2206]
MANLNLTLNVRVVGGPQVSVARTKVIEAYDKIDVVLNPGDTDISVEIQPGAATQVGFLLIKSSLYSQADPDPTITYTVSDGATDFPAVGAGLELDDPHIYIGGALAVFGLAPRILRFTNAYAADPANPAINRAMIEIFVGRDATP